MPRPPHPEPLKPLNVLVTLDQSERLAEESLVTGIPKSVIVRRAVERALQKEKL